METKPGTHIVPLRVKTVLMQNIIMFDDNNTITCVEKYKYIAQKPIFIFNFCCKAVIQYIHNHTMQVLLKMVISSVCSIRIDHLC